MWICLQHDCIKLPPQGQNHTIKILHSRGGFRKILWNFKYILRLDLWLYKVFLSMYMVITFLSGSTCSLGGAFPVSTTTHFGVSKKHFCVKKKATTPWHQWEKGRRNKVKKGKYEIEFSKVVECCLKSQRRGLMDMTLFAPKGTHSQYYFSNSNQQQTNGDHQIALDMQTNNSCHTSTSRSSESGEPCADTAGGNKWASKLLKECARAISDKDSSKIHHLLWMLNELASPYGDCDQKLASYFLQALFCKATESGQRCYKTLTSVAEKSHSFDSARKLILKFQEVSPWTTFGHVASNGAILEALDGETNLHIIDISNTLCTQWPTLLEALATRSDETPHLKLTVVVTASLVRSVMKEIGQRMEKFARLMGVPFEFDVITTGLNQLTKETLCVKEDEAVAVNCIGALRRVAVEDRGDLIQMFQSLKPKVVTIVEEEADLTSSRYDFVKCFEECLRFYTLYFEMLEESFVPTSNERLMLERECSRSIVRVLACDDDNNNNSNNNNNNNGGDHQEEEKEECERRERGSQWSEKLKEAAFSQVGFSDDVVDDVKALLKRYRAGWGLVLPQQGDDINPSSSGIYLAWKDEPVVWASAWKP